MEKKALCSTVNNTVKYNNSKLKLILVFLIAIVYSSFIINSSYTDNGSLAQIVNDCGNLNTTNGVYTLSNNVNSSTTCFNIRANNITLNCNGYEINYSHTGSTVGYGINITGYNYTKVNNCRILEGKSTINSKYAILLSQASNVTIYNNTINTSGIGSTSILLTTFSYNNNLTENMITSLGNSMGIEFYNPAHYNTINNNTIISNSRNNGNGGIRIYASIGNIFTSNNVKTPYGIGYSFYTGGLTNCNNSVDSSNLAEGKPVNYTFNSDNLYYDGIDFTQYGQVMFCGGNNLTILNSNFSDDSLQIYTGKNITVSYNNFTTSNSDGIALSDLNNATISHNFFNSVGYYNDGIVLGIISPPVSNSSVINNTIYTNGSGSYGITLYATSNNLIKDNIFNTFDYGMSVLRNTNSLFINNIIRTNAVNSMLGIEYRYENNNNTFIGLKSYTPASSSYPFYIRDTLQNVTIIDSVLNNSKNGADFYVNTGVVNGTWNMTNVTREDRGFINVTWSKGSNGTLNVHWYLDVNVTDANNVFLPNANVTVYDNVSSTIRFSVNTSSDGFIPKQTLLEYAQFNQSNRILYSNYTINVSAEGYNSQLLNFNLSGNTILNFSLNPSDNLYPLFSNYFDDNSSIVNSGIAKFNVTIENTNGTVFLQINNTNYTATNLTSNVYNVSVNLSSNGTYSYYWGGWGNGTNHLYNVSELKYYVILSDTTIPNISIVFPLNNSGNDMNLTFIYNVTDESGISNCSLILNNQINRTNSSITNGTNQNFTLNNLDIGIYNFSINCTDSSNNIGNTETRKFSIVKMNSFLGNTTDLTQVNISNVTNLIIDSPSLGKINFSQSVDLSSGADIDTHINISFNRIEINSSALPSLNVSAKLMFYGLSFTTPRILKDGAVCPSSICTQEDYSSGVLTFNVTGFSVYSAEETPVSNPTSSKSGRGSVRDKCSRDNDCNFGYSCYNYKCVKLFDVKIIRIDSPLAPRETLDFTYFVKGMAEIKGDVIIDFWLEKDNKTIIKGKDTIYFGTFEEKTESTTMFLPSDISEGKYTFYVQTDYQGHKTISQRDIEIIKKPDSNLDITIVQFPKIKENQNKEFSLIVGFNKDTSILVKLNEKITTEGKIIWEKTKILEVNRSLIINEETSKLKSGNYTLEINAEYDNKELKFVYDFNVIKATNSYLLIFITILFLLIVFLTLVISIKKKKMVKKVLKKVNQTEEETQETDKKI